jgi:ribosomal 50S subunit-recycling heat shock protein
MKVAAVMFPGSHAQYDYLCPFDEVKAGDEVVVNTKRGEATVIVAEIKNHSDRATATILRKADGGRRHPF